MPSYALPDVPLLILLSLSEPAIIAAAPAAPTPRLDVRSLNEPIWKALGGGCCTPFAFPVELLGVTEEDGGGFEDEGGGVEEEEGGGVGSSVEELEDGGGVDEELDGGGVDELELELEEGGGVELEDDEGGGSSVVLEVGGGVDDMVDSVEDSVGVEEGGGVGAAGGEEEGVSVGGGEEEGVPVDEEDRVGNSGGKEGRDTDIDTDEGGAVGLKAPIQRENTLNRTNTYPEDEEDESDMGGVVDASDVEDDGSEDVVEAGDVIGR
ncbi:hypothetical protein EST38_g12224 [Candolleomyces aberdarensis]|uniref:Uncharacterized protein n=1 Tax=Candolleomyces aberdarensis TaxID=2316362 RepID=A0A4Q2D306_9AGAR|nr:hypothetical protein EST38_g12224 [Candolleomyces aberdarensis]